MFNNADCMFKANQFFVTNKQNPGLVQHQTELGLKPGYLHICSTGVTEIFTNHRNIKLVCKCTPKFEKNVENKLFLETDQAKSHQRYFYLFSEF